MQALRLVLFPLWDCVYTILNHCEATAELLGLVFFSFHVAQPRFVLLNLLLEVGLAGLDALQFGSHFS